MPPADALCTCLHAEPQQPLSLARPRGPPAFCGPRPAGPSAGHARRLAPGRAASCSLSCLTWSLITPASRSAYCDAYCWNAASCSCCPHDLRYLRGTARGQAHCMAAHALLAPRVACALLSWWLAGVQPWVQHGAGGVMQAMHLPLCHCEVASRAAHSSLLLPQPHVPPPLNAPPTCCGTAAPCPRAACASAPAPVPAAT